MRSPGSHVSESPTYQNMWPRRNPLSNILPGNYTENSPPTKKRAPKVKGGNRNKPRAKKLVTTNHQPPVKQPPTNNRNKCAKCGTTYDSPKDKSLYDKNSKYYTWVGCENEEECNYWVHQGCAQLTDADLELFFCEGCS